ncbi:hypothetical protein RDI58_028944 [Solanum bulbocastanum]|uniref:BHLH domain-containing protein n=1 Tax=Solanum bulbocastanum TaxID=147425 RepID=A0AAN8SX72_SOLBU
MSTRRRRSPLKFTQDEINDLVLKLEALLPNSSSRCTSTVATSKILEETCNYIKILNKKLDDLSLKLASIDGEAFTILLQQLAQSPDEN